MPIVYSLPDRPNVAIIYPAEGFDGWKDVPDNAVNPRFISHEDIENSHPDFAYGWRDLLPGNQLDVCHRAVKDVLLADMKKRQAELLEQVGIVAISSLLGNDQEHFLRLQNQYASIKDAHKALEALEVSGYNDYATLRKIQELVKLPEIVG